MNAEYLDVDHFDQYEDNGEPIARGDILDLQAKIEAMSRRQEQLLNALRERRQQPQEPARPREEKLPEPPSLGHDDPDEDEKVSSKVYSIWWKKVQMWVALVEGRVEPVRYAALVANKLKGKAADAIWLGANDSLTTLNGLNVIKRVLDNLFFGDQTAAICQNVNSVLEFKRPKGGSMREYVNEFRNRLQLLDNRGESLPLKTRGHLLLSNCGLSEDQKALVMATTARDLSFNSIADALILLFPLSLSSAQDTQQGSYWGAHTEGRGKGGGQGRGRGGGKGGKGRFNGNCHNCGIVGHKSSECFRPGGGAHKPSPAPRLAMTAAANGGTVRGATLSIEERLHQMEDLLANVTKTNFGGMAATTELALLSLKNEGLDEGAIIDNGCTSNVCSEGWLIGFERKMDKKYQRIPLSNTESVKTFVFGSGPPKVELYKVHLDLQLFGQTVTIPVSVVEGSQTPFLLSRQQLKLWKAKIDLEDNSLRMELNGQPVYYLCPTTSSDLMVLPLTGIQLLQRPEDLPDR